MEGSCSFRIGKSVASIVRVVNVAMGCSDALQAQASIEALRGCMDCTGVCNSGGVPRR